MIKISVKDPEQATNDDRLSPKMKEQLDKLMETSGHTPNRKVSANPFQRIESGGDEPTDMSEPQKGITSKIKSWFGL